MGCIIPLGPVPDSVPNCLCSAAWIKVESCIGNQTLQSPHTSSKGPALFILDIFKLLFIKMAQ